MDDTLIQYSSWSGWRSRRSRKCKRGGNVVCHQSHSRRVKRQTPPSFYLDIFIGLRQVQVGLEDHTCKHLIRKRILNHLIKHEETLHQTVWSQIILWLVWSQSGPVKSEGHNCTHSKKSWQHMCAEFICICLNYCIISLHVIYIQSSISGLQTATILVAFVRVQGDHYQVSATRPFHSQNAPEVRAHCASKDWNLP